MRKEYSPHKKRLVVGFYGAIIVSIIIGIIEFVKYLLK